LILNAIIIFKLATTAFPIHDDEYLKKLGAEWYQMKHAFKPQPIGK
jgi:hypothetical protein